MAVIKAAAIATGVQKPKCDFIRCIAISAVIVSIIGVAIAILTSQYVMLAGFILLGVTSTILGILGVQKTTALLKVQKELKADVSQLNEGNKKLERLTQEMGKQTAEFQNLQKNWELERGKLEQNNRDLAQTKAALEQDLGKLNQAYQGMKLQVQQFLNLNLEMGKHIGAFQKGGAELAQKEEQLKGVVANFDQQLEQNVEQLHQQLQLGKETAAAIVKFAKEQQETEHADALRLQATVQQLQAVEAAWRASQARFQQDQQNLAKREQDLNQLSQQLTVTQRGVDALKLQLDAQAQKIGQDNQRTASEVAKLEKLKGEIAAMPSLETVKQRAAVLEDLNNKILTAIDQLKKHKAATV